MQNTKKAYIEMLKAYDMHIISLSHMSTKGVLLE